jgi:hypothetical protein
LRGKLLKARIIICSGDFGNGLAGDILTKDWNGSNVNTSENMGIIAGNSEQKTA